ncbi:MAG: HAMP domain-containing histidine kinase [Candidatus Schekmanbacteria bacterium]|nr:HAMP domain-containing histidine kinase [Candidatus Schekmanbacteria bacterium]
MLSTRFTRLLSFKLFFLLMLLLVVLFSLYMYINLKLNTDHLMSAIIASANRSSDLIKNSTRYSMLKNQKEDVDQIITTLSSLSGMDGIRIYNKKGIVMFSGNKDENGRAVDMKAEACNICHSEKIPKAALSSTNRTRIFNSSNGHRVLGLINPIENAPDCSNAPCHAHPPETKILGVLDIKMSLEQVDKNISESQTKMIYFALLFILSVAMASGVFIWIMVHNPVKKLTIGTQEISKRNFDYRIDVKSDDEIGELANSFNFMMTELKKAYNEITNWSKSLELRVKEKTEELEKTQSHIVQMEKMASLGKLSATVAHEINNPLGGILTYTKLLMRKLEKVNIGSHDPSILEFLKIIESESKRCGKIVKDLLVFAKSSSVNFSRENIKSIIEKSIALVNHHLEIKNIKVVKKLPDSDYYLACDSNQIQQAFIALLINSVEAMPVGGTITIEVLPFKEENQVRINITDTGVGIPEEIIPNIFEPFFTTKKDGSGVGLGLSVVYGIIKKHNGDINVYSKINEETTFTIVLPTNLSVGEHDIIDHVV